MQSAVQVPWGQLALGDQDFSLLGNLADRLRRPNRTMTFHGIPWVIIQLLLFQEFHRSAWALMEITFQQKGRALGCHQKIGPRLSGVYPLVNIYMAWKTTILHRKISCQQAMFNSYVEVSENRGTPIYHRVKWDFPINHPAIGDPFMVSPPCHQAIYLGDHGHGT